MSASTPAASESKVLLWIGRALSTLPVLGLVMSGVMKLMNSPDVAKEFTRLGYNPQVALKLGIVELVCTVLYLIPQTAVLGAILLTGYLGGAVATHVRIGEGFVPPIVVGVLVWGGLVLRDSRLRSLLPWRRS